jgi:hypothetical protein
MFIFREREYQIFKQHLQMYGRVEYRPILNSALAGDDLVSPGQEFAETWRRPREVTAKVFKERVHLLGQLSDC